MLLPRSSVTSREIPAEYGARDYRYTAVNDRTLVVDPGTDRVVDVID